MRICDKEKSYIPYMVLIKIYFGFKFFYVCKAHYPKLLLKFFYSLYGSKNRRKF